MILSGPEIIKVINRTRKDRADGAPQMLPAIDIEPFNLDQVNPNSYNLRISDKLLIYPAPILDMKLDNITEEITIPPEGFVLFPGILYLGSTMEYTFTHGVVPRIDGRSSGARLGLCVHLTAGFGDTFFAGTWTLELTVVQPLRIYAGVQVCQISYEGVTGELQKYQGKYQGQSGPQKSKLWKDFIPQEKQPMN